MGPSQGVGAPPEAAGAEDSYGGGGSVGGSWAIEWSAAHYPGVAVVDTGASAKARRPNESAGLWRRACCMICSTRLRQAKQDEGNDLQRASTASVARACSARSKDMRKACGGSVASACGRRLREVRRGRAARAYCPECMRAASHRVDCERMH